MPQIPLPTGIKGDSDTPKQKEHLINCYFEPGDTGSLIGRPGVRDYLEAYGRSRGGGKYNGNAYYVQADQLIKVTDDGISVTYDLIGTISGSNDCLLIPSFTKLLIMVKDGDAYVWDDSTLEQITDVLYQTSIWATFIFSRFVFVPSDGGPYFWSDLNDPANIDPSDFADAETLPDKNFAVEELNDNLIVFGGATIERHVFNTNFDTFQRQNGATKNIGFAGGLARYGETLAFIGFPINGTFSIYLYGMDQPVSNSAVDEVLNEYSLGELRVVHADFFSWKGLSMVVWQLPRHDILFYGGFAFIHSGVTGTVEGKWKASFIQEFNGKLICGDRESNNLGQLADISTDFGEDVEHEVVTFLRSSQPRSDFLLKRIFASATTGQTNEDRRISLQVSEDGVHYGPENFISLGKKGVYNNEISWGSPIGQFDNFCGLKFRWVGDIKVPIDGVSYE